MQYKFDLKGVCAKQAIVTLSDDGKNVILGIDLLGGCDGQRQSINALAKGMTAGEFVSRVIGITCGSKNTSCAAELAKALLPLIAVAKYEANETENEQ